MSHRALSVVLCCTALLSCASQDGTLRRRALAGPPLAVRRSSAAEALRALQESRFDDARRLAGELIAKDWGNPFARAVDAVARYKAAMHQLSGDLVTVAFAAFRLGTINEPYLRSAVEQAEKELVQIDEDLAVAGASPDFGLELCVACLKVDWNRNGRVDHRDKRFLEVELDAEGQAYPDGDPRRRPTFRFDQGDLAWARAFVSFQRAALSLLIAWDLGNVNALLGAARGSDRSALQREVVIKLRSPERIATARKLILEGLKRADEARQSYLAETDDDREWLPNPRQRSHPLPLPVDDALYQVWEQVLGDLRRIVGGDEGLSVVELAQLGDHRWESPPQGFVDVGGMLRRPKDLVLDLRRLAEASKQLHRDRAAARPEALLREALGDYYQDSMRPSPLIQRLERMKSEVKRGSESLERKLRYLIWLN